MTGFEAMWASGICLAIVLGAMFLLWLLSVASRDASIVDPFWGFGFVIIAWWCFFTSEFSQRGLLLLILTTLWGLRLSVYLLWRNWGKGEDRRYRAMRETHGERFWFVSLATVFILQGLIMWFVSWPVQFGVLLGEETLGILDCLVLGLWVIGITFETIGDLQLAKFKSDPANQGRVLSHGLWRYTRHPNYFGDFCVWWGIYGIAASGGAWWTVGSPLLMSLFLMRVSGVTLLEKDIADRRPEYGDYIRDTNAFFPGLPRTPG